MNEQLVLNMQDLIFDIYEKKVPQLQEDFVLNLWQNDEIQVLNKVETDALKEGIKKSEKEGLLEICGSQENIGDVAITLDGIKYLTERKMKKRKVLEAKSSTNINVTVGDSSNVNVGNGNIIKSGITPEEFVSILRELDQKSEEDKKGIFEKLTHFVKKGFTIVDLAGKLKELLKEQA